MRPSARLRATAPCSTLGADHWLRQGETNKMNCELTKRARRTRVLPHSESRSLGERQRLVDPQTCASKKHDQRSGTQARRAIASTAHHRDDLVDGRRVGWATSALCCGAVGRNESQAWSPATGDDQAPRSSAQVMRAGSPSASPIVKHGKRKRRMRHHVKGVGTPGRLCRAETARGWLATRC